LYGSDAKLFSLVATSKLKKHQNAMATPLRALNYSVPQTSGLGERDKKEK